MELTAETVAGVVAVALAEDVGDGDRTTDGIVPADARCSAVLLLREAGVVCGLQAAASVFTTLDSSVVLDLLVDDGSPTDGPVTLARIEGSARAVLTGERVALNLLGRLCGIATLTARYVGLVEGTGATILDTRKTTPGLRALEKYAVRCGGGTNHRAGLYDAVLIKENHLRLVGGIRQAVSALEGYGGPVEIEAETLEEVVEALDARADRILLDNMSPDEVARAVEVVGGRVPLEASGGITLSNVRAYAEAGVDFISVGALTHSARSLDVSLELE